MALEDTEWTADAQDWIEEAAKRGTPFDVNDLRADMRPAPRSGMYGGAFIAAQARGVIVQVDRSRAMARSSHHRSIARWTGVPDPVRDALRWAA